MKRIDRTLRMAAGKMGPPPDVVKSSDATGTHPRSRKTMNFVSSPRGLLPLIFSAEGQRIPITLGKLVVSKHIAWNGGQPDMLTDLDNELDLPKSICGS